MSREIERFDYGQVSPATGLADSAAAVNYVLEHESLAYLMGVGNDLSGPVSPTDIPVNLVIENTFLPAFDVPKFVPRMVGDMMTAAWLAILSQRYSGSVYADLLTEVELMATVAARVDELQVAMFDKQLIFMASVEKMRGAAVFEETQRKFGEFALHSAVYGRNAARGQVFNSVPELVRRKCSITVVAGNYGVLRYGGSCDAEDIPVMLPVVTDALHRALLRIPAKHVGKTMHVSVRRRADGLYYFTDVYDEACSYPVDALPEGEAVLEGMYGAPVRTSLLSSLLISVRVLPVLKHVHGYCYLGCVPHRTRWQASQVLGMSPSRADIERVAPDVHDWCVVEAGFEEVKTIACGPSGTRVRVLHITSDGSMPSRVGRDDVLAGDADSDRRYAQAELNSLFEGVRAKASRAPPAAAGAKVPAGLGPGLVPFPNARVRPRGDSVSARSVDSDVSAGTKISGSPLVIGRKRTAYTSTLDVPRAVQGLDLGDEECFNIAWDDVPDGLVRAWAARLAEGAPVGPADLMRLARLTPDSLPDPPYPRGTAVAMATDHEPPDMADFPAWKQRTFPIPGWAMESVDVRVKLKKGQRKCLALVPPISGTFCRYEFAFDRDVNVSQSVGVVGSKSVLWLKGAATVDVDSEGTIVRLWCSSGVPALGVLSTSMMVGFSCAAIHSYSSNVTMDSVVTLRLVKSAGGQGMLKYAAEVSAASLVGEVYLHIGDDIPGEPVCFVAEADGLRSVTVAGVKVPAKKGVRASVVVQRARFSVRFSFVAGCAAKVVLSMVVIDRVGKFLDEVGKFASRGLLARSRGIERLALTGG